MTTTIRNSINAWEQLVKDNPSGYLTGQKCLRCKKKLEGQGQGHPAESYLGTFTGLCDCCMAEPAFIVRFFADGAREWSHPPSSPSWRRDRAIFIGYPGCKACKGKGGVTAYDNQGSPYLTACMNNKVPAAPTGCLIQFTRHPVRAHYEHRRTTKWRYIRGREKRLDVIRRRGGPMTEEDFISHVQARVARFEEHLQRWQAAFAERHGEIINGTPWE